MKKLIYTFLTRQLTSSMLLMSVCVMGVFSFLNIPIELSPQIQFPKLSISSNWQGVGSETVEAYLTSPLEATVASVKGLKKITSQSTEGNSYIELEFQPNTNMDYARLELNEKINAVKDELPTGVSSAHISEYIPKSFQDLQGFLTFTVTANCPAEEIKKQLDENCKNELLSINGISDILIQGGNTTKIDINIDYNKAKAFGVANEDITTALNESELVKSAGNIEINSSQIAIKICNSLNSIKDIQNLPIKYYKNGAVIKIKDIGEVALVNEEPKSILRINGKDAVSIEITKDPGSNTIKTAEAVFNKIKQIKAVLPSDYIITKEIDKSKTIKDELNSIYYNLFYSFCIIAILLSIIFRRLKYSFIIIISIIITLLLSFFIFFILKISINIVTLSSLTISIGIIVDNSIIIIDFLDKNYDYPNKKRLTILLNNLFLPVLSSTLTTSAVFIPLIILTGELKFYYVQFAIATVITIFSSLFISFTAIPLLIIKFKANGCLHKRKRLLFPFYLNLISKMLKWKVTSILLLILILGLPLWLLPQRIENKLLSPIYNPIMESTFYNEIKPYIDYALGGSINLFINHIKKGEIWEYGDETYLSIVIQMPTGNNINTINTIVKELERNILSLKNKYKSMTTKIYNTGLAVIRIDFTEDQSRTASPYLIKHYLNSYAGQLGGLDVTLSGFGPGYSYSESGTSNSFIVKVTGYNYNKVKKIAENLSSMLKTNPRVENVDIDKTLKWGIDQDSYEVVGMIRRENVARYNISINNLVDIIAKHTNGNLSYSNIKINNNELKYELKYSNYSNTQLNKLSNILIQNGNGGFFRIKDLVNFDQKKILPAINREERQYLRYITIDYNGSYSLGNEYLQSTIKNMLIPEGYKIQTEELSFSSSQEELEVWKMLVIAVIIIFMITAGLFESYKKPFLIILAIPFAFIGTVILFYIGDYTINRGAYAGILLLIGISVNNSIILVDYLSIKLYGINYEKVISLAYTRIRPIFTTTFTTISGLLPIMLGAKEDFWRSLTLSVTGGILFSSLFVIFYIPFFFILINKIKVKNEL